MMQRSKAGDRERALALCPELIAIAAELAVYEELLRRWQKTINLVAPGTLGHIWSRHFADSAQVRAAAPQVRLWADLGSGAGFPGLVTALLLKGAPGAAVHLIESDQRKAAFLRAVSRETGAPTEIHAGRIEDILADLSPAPEAISARALAPLATLVDMIRIPLEKSAIGVFLKGADWRNELTLARAKDNLLFRTIESRTDPDARLIIVGGCETGSAIPRDTT
jgi:16S rRNA (guanine527-N7)-methyltransferase